MQRRKLMISLAVLTWVATSLLATTFTATCEMVVTARRPQAEVRPIRGRESFDSRDAFFDKVDYFRDPDFWRDYNIIEPSETLDHAIGRLMKRYK